MQKKSISNKIASVQKMVLKKQSKPWLELFIPDAHAPYHDVLALALICKVGKQLKVDGVTNLGDAADMERFSRFKKVVNRLPVQSELAAADLIFQKQEQIGAKRKRFLKGNHEIRFEDWVAESSRTHLEGFLHRKEVEKLVHAKPHRAFEDFFDLNERGWETTPYGECAIDHQLVMSHTLGKNYMSAAKLEKALSRLENHSLIVGHSHFSCKVGYQTFINKVRVEGYTFGWVGSREAGLYRSHFEVLTEWPLGFGLGYCYPDGQWDIYALKIDPVNYTARIFGNEYSLTKEEKKAAFEEWSDDSLQHHKLSMFSIDPLYRKFA